MTSIVMEEYELLGDSKYRSYMSLVDKALKGFEYTTEWADLIAALGKLNKVLLGHMKYPIIPRRIVISKRLAQCMHPALPSGVHLKALDTYDIIFKCMGTNRLAQELFIYSAGLFPLLGHAAMNVRPQLLTVYETHFVPLGERLRPALNGLLSGVLPGLEEGSDHFSRTNKLLESVCDATTPPVFYGAMWECIASNHSIRLPAISFILQHLDRKISLKDQPHIIGNDLDVMVRAVVMGVQDQSVLVQRNALDLLMTSFPIHEKFLSEEDMTDLVTAACSVLLRRDMSLNRRLFSWLLGSDVATKTTAPNTHIRQESVSSTLSTDSAPGKSFYFDFYSKTILIEALRKVLQKSLQSSQQPNLKPYRLLTTLLDKAEIGPLIIDSVIIDVFRTLFHSYYADDKFRKGESAIGKQELMKGANLLFSTFESNYIWEVCGQAFEKASEADDRINDTHKDVNNIGKEEATVIEMCSLIEFLLEVVSIETYRETNSKHLPVLFKKIVETLSGRCKDLSTREITSSLNLTSNILSRIQPAWNVWDAQEQLEAHDDDDDFIEKKPDSIGTDDEEPTIRDSPEVAKEATESPLTSPVRKDSSTSAQRLQYQLHEQLMHECAQAFQVLFVTIMKSKVFPDDFTPDFCIAHLVKTVSKTDSNDTKNEHSLDSLNGTLQNEYEEEIMIQKLHKMSLPMRDGKNICNLEEALTTVCQILVDLSSIPTVSKNPLDCESGSPEFSPSSLPLWLQYLLICSCLLDLSQASLQLQCISTLLELIGLFQSTMLVSSEAATSRRRFEKNNIVIVMMPILREGHYCCIMKQTLIPQVIASHLWNGLGTMHPMLHLKCVSLLHQLHNLVPNPRMIERILARSLGHGPVKRDHSFAVDAYQKFTLLWHLSRDIELKVCGRKPRTFDICLLKMMDNLNLSSGPLKALAQSWLVHALAKGDIARLMEPLFLTLLDPSTARVSVLHAKIVHSDTVDSPEGSHNIYSIGCANNEVVYHVSSLSSLDKVSDTQKAKRIFALNKFRKCSPPRQASNSGAIGNNEDSSNSEQNDLQTLSLLVNPFALVPPHLEEYSFYTKGYPNVDGNDSSSDDISASTDNNEPEENTTEEVDDSSSSRPESRMSMAKLFGEDEGNEKAPLPRPSSMDSCKMPTLNEQVRRALNIHPLHSHLLLYCQVCDSRQILYTMQCVKNIITTNPRLAICTLSTSNLNSSSSARKSQIQMLLARHRKSVFGQNFAGSLSSENMSTYRNSTLIEVLISTLLYYLRSYYPNLGQVRLSEEEIQSNREVQIMSIDIMSALVSELVLIVQDNGKAYATYILDLFSRCKVQKVVLHSLLAGINDMRDNPRKKEEEEMLAFTEDILNFNEVYSSKKEGSNSSVSSDRISNYSEAFQVQVLRLLLSLVMLEQAICQQRGEAPDKMKLSPNDASGSSTPGASNGGSILRYHNDHVIPDQPMFLAAIVSALKQEKMRHLHSHWTSLFTSCLPFLGKSLSQAVLEITNQISRNLEHLAPFYKSESKSDPEKTFGHIPADYIVTQLEALTMIYHYCLLDNSSQVSTSFAQPNQVQQQPSQQNQSEIFSNLLHVFLSNTDTKQLATKSLGMVTSVDSLAIARKILVSTLPRLINTVGVLWQCLSQVTKSDSSCVLVGVPRVVRSRLLDMLSPIAHHHQTAFISAVGIIWQDRKGLQSPGMIKHPLPACNDDQKVLVELTGAIKTLPVSVIIQTVRQVLKSPPNVSVSKINVEVSVLQFFYAYLAQCSTNQVFESWNSLAGLLRDCLNLAAPAIFLALSILNQFIQRSPSFSERKDQKELQEIAGKLVDACGNIGGSCLEQTTWLRRNLAVKSELLQEMSEEDQDIDLSNSKIEANEESGSIFSGVIPGVSESKSKDKSQSMQLYAVPALCLLGEMLAPLLDIIFTSDEKEKVLPLLYNVMTNVMPYLRNHTKSNLASFRACSKLLASLSEYQYTRKAWKKDSFDLLLEPSFFQMDLLSLQQWKIIVDNLMTHDKTTFKELMTKISSISQSGSLSLFSSKEQELEQRALLLKRLAFVLFCSDEDQYQKQMPDIQERLAESLRTIPTSPSVQGAVFLCFRVILLRMSPQHVTSLWPQIITEMVQIFSFLEQELLTDTEEWSDPQKANSSHLKRLSTLDTSWVVSAGSNGLMAHSSPQWLHLYLQVCKLLDLTLALPASSLPQFQMYRWAFVSEGGTELSFNIDGAEGVNGAVNNFHQPPQDFVPYVVRVAKLLLQKMTNVQPAVLKEGQLQLTMTSISSLEDLGPFFASICNNVTRQQTKSSQKKLGRFNSGNTGHKSEAVDESRQIINAILERDFLE